MSCWTVPCSIRPCRPPSRLQKIKQQDPPNSICRWPAMHALVAWFRPLTRYGDWHLAVLGGSVLFADVGAGDLSISSQDASMIALTSHQQLPNYYNTPVYYIFFSLYTLIMRLSSGIALLAFAPTILGQKITLYSEEDYNNTDDFSYVYSLSGLRILALEDSNRQC